MTEVVIRWCSIKKMFLKKKNRKIHWKTPAPESLIKLQTSDLQLYLKRDSGTGVFLGILREFSEHLFCRISANDLD